jgi:hypothetical protein
MHKTIVSINDVEELKCNLSEPDDDSFRPKHVRS